MQVETLRRIWRGRCFIRQARRVLGPVDEIPEPHGFDVTMTPDHGGHAHSYRTSFVEHDHGHGDHDHGQDDDSDPKDDPPTRGGTALLARKARAPARRRSRSRASA